MFIELIKPEVLPIYYTKDRVKLRIREKGAPGRLILNLTFESAVELKAFVDSLVTELQKPLPRE